MYRIECLHSNILVLKDKNLNVIIAIEPGRKDPPSIGVPKNHRIYIRTTRTRMSGIWCLILYNCIHLCVCIQR